MKALALAARVGMTCIGLYGRGRRNAQYPRLVKETFSFPSLPPALDGLSILHLSDFHFSQFDTVYSDAVIDLVRGVSVDLCLITGDYKYGHYGPANHVYPLMTRMLEGITAACGVFGILGNHDLGVVVEGLTQCGLEVLVNEGRLLEVRGVPVWVGGTDDPHKFHGDSVEAALFGAPEEAFKILLVHAPENVPEAVAQGVDLYLAGHTHGGQIRFPLIGALRMNARCDPAYTLGRWRCGGMQGYTSQGLGTTDIPLRYNCPTEAAVLTLRRGD